MRVRGDHDPVVRAAVRVWDRQHEVVGGGFVVGPGLVATCAHVVADALGADPYDDEPPEAPVQLDLPLLPGGGSAPVAAVVERWVPIDDDGGGDIALLRLGPAAPPAARMPPLRRIDRLWDHGFRVFGFPEGARAGVWATGLIRGRQGTGWFQLQGDPDGRRIEGGFSGAPVWDLDSGAVVGMAVAADRGGTTTAYLVPIDQVLGVDPAALPCPYRGLAPFGEQDAGLFFGREDDVERVAEVLRRRSVVAVAGPSGVGKSSLVRAGLVPRLRASGARVEDVRLLPGEPVRLPAPAPGLVLVLDQFEELAAERPEAARDLLARIAGASGSGVRAVLTVRWSALDQLLTADLAATLQDGTVLLAPLGRGGLRAAVVGPAERAPGLDFEDGLVERILDDAGADPGVLPLVAALLADLWRRREGGCLTLAGYAAAGGVAGAVAQQAERATAAAAADPAGPERLRRLFTLLAGPDQDGGFVRRPVLLTELPAELRGLVPALVHDRLLVVDAPGTPGGTVQLAHQALIEHWPRLRDWLAEDREFVAWRAQLDGARDRWAAAAGDDGALLRGTALAAATGWTATRSAELTDDQREYVHRSVARNRREVRRWRAVTAVLAVLVLAAGALAVVITRRGDEIATRLATANAELLGDESVARAADDPVLAAQLALAAWRSDPTSPLARTGLFKAGLAMRSVDAEFPDAVDGPGEVLARGDAAVVASASGLAAVTGIAGSTPTRRDLPGGSADRPRAMSPDGRLAADVDGAGEVRIHDLAAAAAPRSLAPARAGEQTAALVFSPDGARLGQVVTRPAGAAALRVLDVATGAVVAPELALPGDRPGAWLTSDPDRAVVRSAWGAPAEVRSLIDGAVLSTLPDGAEIALDGDAVVTCQRADAADSFSDAVVTVTPLAGGAAERQVRAAGICAQLMLTADGAALVDVSSAFSDADQVLLRVTDLRDGRAVQITAPPFDRASASRGFPVLPAALVAGPGGRPDLLVRSGRALLRLRGDAAPGAVGKGQPDRSLDSSRRYLVGSTDTAITVEDRATATPLASMPRPAGTDSWAVADDLWIVVPDAGGWRLDRHQLPTLRLLSSYPLPTGPEKPVLWTPDGSDPGPGVALAGGRLVAFDVASGQPIGAGVAVDARGADRDGTAQLFWGRPGHPGQALVFTRSSHLQLWDAVARRQLVDIDFVAGILAGQGHVAAAFDPTGRRLVLGNGKTATEYDADTGKPVRDPIPLSADGHVAGFAADGFLVAYAPDQSIALIDLERGRESGSAKPVDAPLVQEVAAGGGWLAGAGSDGVLPVEVPLTARSWFDEVCAASGARPFTPAELAILPAGASQDPPCS